MRTTSESVVVHQSVHGYSDGHRLLSTSRKVKKSSARRLRVLSDLSGPGTYREFDGYITAYPLEGDGSYAIGRTWIANEIHRPGCVWTHTLILSCDDLTEIQEPAQLISLFKRPSLETLADYERALSLPPTKPSTEPDDEPFEAPIAERLVGSFYTTGEPIYVVSGAPARLAGLLLRLWLQYLRFTSKPFSFCTGAIRSRNLDSNPLDVQVIPPEALRDVARSIPSAAVVHDEIEQVPHDESADWAQDLALDLLRAEPGGVREFVSRYAGNPDREAIGVLARLHHSIAQVESQETELYALVNEVAESFPKSTDRSAMKQAVFGDPDSREFLKDIDDPKLLAAIVDSEFISAFDLSSLCLSERLTTEWRDNSAIIVKILSQLAEHASAESSRIVREVLAEGVTESEVKLLWQFDEDVVFDVVQQNPQLMTSRGIWKHLDPVKLAPLFERCSREFSDGELAAILAVQLDESVTGVARQMAQYLGDSFVYHVLDWANQPTFGSFDSEWWNEVKSRPGPICGWLDGHRSASAHLVAKLSTVLGPRSSHVQRLDVRVWLGFGEASTEELERSELHDLLTFLLVLGLESSDDAAAEVIAIAFPQVYAAVEKRALGHRCLALLDQSLPGVVYWNDSKRLRAGLVQAFASNNWPTGAFLRASSDPRVLDKILDMKVWERRETRYLRKVTKARMADPEAP